MKKNTQQKSIFFSAKLQHCDIDCVTMFSRYIVRELNCFIHFKLAEYFRYKFHINWSMQNTKPLKSSALCTYNNIIFFACSSAWCVPVWTSAHNSIRNKSPEYPHHVKNKPDDLFIQLFFCYFQFDIIVFFCDSDFASTWHSICSDNNLWLYNTHPSQWNVEWFRMLAFKLLFPLFCAEYFVAMRRPTSLNKLIFY